MLIINILVTGQQNKNQESSQLTEKINYYANDSVVIDLEIKKTFLYNEAHIDYGDIILDACLINFDFETKTVFAKYCLDSNNSKIGIPVLSDGSTSTTSD